MVIVPVRNEEASLGAALDALAGQCDLHGHPLPADTFEILLLLNNCTDRSAEVALAWQAAHAGVALHVVRKTLPPEHAHVGAARRLLMDTAWSRLQGRPGCCGILSTDSDTMVAPDWIAQNLRALERGADAVGGVIELKPGQLDSLPAGARSAYLADRAYQRLVARLEDLLDPQPGDPWPRHLQHFGASLACTPQAYQAAGGLPPLPSLEDMAFVNALRHIDARFRHEPAVRVFTSGRFDGRTQVGLAWQLRTWQHMYETGEPQRVPNAAWLQHRFRSLRKLRELHARGPGGDLDGVPAGWRERIAGALAEHLTLGGFQAAIGCDAWIEQTCTATVREAEIREVIRELRRAVQWTRRVRETSSPLIARAGANLPGTARPDAR